MSAAYTSLDNFSSRLPSGVPEDFQAAMLASDEDATDDEILTAWKARIAEVIKAQGAYIDDSVGGRYGFSYNGNKFPAYSNTPKTIQEICNYLCLYELLGEYKGTMQGRADDTMLHYRNLAEDKLKQIRDGEIVISFEGVNLDSTCDVRGAETKAERLATLEEW